MNNYCGFIGLIGKPNVGKSTLLNALLKQKVSITSHRPQTTRHQICGIKTIDNKQMVFVDTPGIHALNNLDAKKLNQYMNQAARKAISEVDMILFLIEAQSFNSEDEQVLSLLEKSKRPVILVINKIDQLKHKEALLPLIDRLSKNILLLKLYLFLQPNDYNWMCYRRRSWIYVPRVLFIIRKRLCVIALITLD